jgi:carotenoid cleavage dioxygenase-like enzyme
MTDQAKHEGLRTVDPAASPYLSGRYAPVSRESDADDLRVEGTLPADIDGVFMRNGPNPRFPPLGSYTYPLEGDGMIHAVWIGGGKARYRNRWVWTNGLKAEERAGRALYGGIMTPAFVDQKLLGPDPDPGWPVKLDAFINIVRHAGHFLALEEGTPPYEVTGELGTIGRFDFGGGLPLGMCAHPRIDPVTGEMVVFRYDVTEPYLTWAVVAPDGSVTRPPAPVPGISKAFMIHDFTITEHYVVFVIGPAILDAEAMLTGGSVLNWRPDLGTRIVLVPRSGDGPVVSAELEPFWVWHFANAYEDGGKVVADFPWWDTLSLAAGDRRAANGQRTPVSGRFSRVSVDPARATADLTHIGEGASEFPRIDDRLTGRRHRYLTVGTASGQHDLTRGEHDRLVRWDMQTGQSQAWDTDASIGEVIFAARNGSAEELDGYYMTLARGLPDDRSWLYIWDAAEFPSPPMARIAIPAAVPNGLHANWFSHRR